jgi:ATP-binding cassette subfamily B protein
LSKERDTKPKKLTIEGLRSTLSIFAYIKPYVKFFVPGMIVLTIGSLLFASIAWICGEMVNVASGKAEYGFTLNELGIVLFVVLGTQALLSFIRTVLFANFSERTVADIRKDVYKKLIAQPFTYYEQNRVGDLSTRITADVEQLQSVLTVTLSELVRQIVTLVAGIIILAWLTPKLSLIMLATIPGVVILAMIFGRYIRNLSRARQKQLGETNTIVDETLQNFSVVKAFANEWYELRRYSKSVDDIVVISLKNATLRGAFFAFMILLMFGSILFILWRGAFLVQSGEMASGDLFSFVMYTVMIGGAIASLGSLYTNLVSAIGATERVKEVLESETEITVTDEQVDVDIPVSGDIQFKNVSFSYPTRKDIQVLKDININVPAGNKIALVGQSGSGKSTIASLLMKFYDLDGGSIVIDGRPLLDYDLKSFRQNIAIVPQEVLLFGGTIKENILYGRPNASEEEIRMAASQANALEFIESFPDGLETIVGERGIKLSGGQRQRVAIARAILRDPKILILDEATSSLDAESEKLVQDALDKLMHGRTSIIIAHRLSTIRDVDQIYVIEGGEIIEKGTHQELSAKSNGAYSNLAKLQFETSNV